MEGSETNLGFQGGEKPDGERYDLEQAQEEASQMQEKIEAGEAKDYADAERLIGETIEGLEGEKKKKGSKSYWCGNKCDLSGIPRCS